MKAFIKCGFIVYLFEVNPLLKCATKNIKSSDRKSKYLEDILIMYYLTMEHKTVL